MPDKGTVDTNGHKTRGLSWARISTRAVMTLERGWPLVLPVLVAISLFLSLSWLGVFRIVPELVRLIAIAFLAIGTLASLYPLRFFRNPTADEIDRRIEAANKLEHTPVLVQTDRPTGEEDAFGQALWREHQKRMAEKLNRLGSDLPRTGVPQRDPWGLHGAAVLLLFVAFAFSFGPLGGRIGDVLQARPGFEAVPARIDAWVTPPAYTGKAPVFLTAENNQQVSTVTVPTGSEISLRVTGGAGDENLSFTDGSGNAREIAPQNAQANADPEATPVAASSAPNGAPRQFVGKLSQNGTLSLKSGSAELRNWAFAVTPDTPPTIRFTGDPRRAANGTLELNYEIEDDYGAASAEAAFTLDEAPPAGSRPLYKSPEMPLALPRRGAETPAAKATRDLTEHVWSGSMVKLALKAKDAAGQESTSEIKTFILPERPFLNPLAKAVIEQRRILALDANKKPDVINLIDAITLRPEDTFDNMSHYLAIKSAQTRLRMAGNDDQLREVVSYLWDIALNIEEGSLSDAEKRLKQAQEALKQALENGASDEEIDQLMAELRDAMNEFMREFAERAQQNPDMAQQMPQNGQELRQSDLDRMMDQIENLAKSGNRDQAQELLSQLEDMMNNLQAGRQQQQQQGQNGEQNEMRQQMDKLGEIMRRQQEMMNETFRMEQQQRGQQGQQGQEGQQGEGQQPGQGQNGRPMTPEEFADALKQLQEGQGKLQQELDGLTKGLEGMGIQPGEGFGEAGEAMGQAEGALGQGEGERAVGQQGRALEALRKGAQDMMQQMQQAMEGEEGGGQEGGRQQNSDRDPLGRPRATTGPDFGNSVKVPGEIDIQRARQILEAIRKRLGNALSPELERDYLERLLDMR